MDWRYSSPNKSSIIQYMYFKRYISFQWVTICTKWYCQCFKKATDKFTYTKVIKEHNIKDFIDPDKLENIRLKSINIEKLYNNQELDFLMFGIAGDYIGTDSSQTIEEILKEKSCDILKNKKCLWATTGPALKIFEEYFSLFKSFIQTHTI